MPHFSGKILQQADVLTKDIHPPVQPAVFGLRVAATNTHCFEITSAAVSRALWAQHLRELTEVTHPIAA